MIQKHTLYCIKQYSVCFLFYFSVINLLNNIEKENKLYVYNMEEEKY